LLTLGPQTVGEGRQIGAVGPAGDLIELITQQRAGVQQQPPDQGALAVVDRARRGQPQQVALIVCFGGAQN
jgi:hypothetical protein